MSVKKKSDDISDDISDDNKERMPLAIVVQGIPSTTDPKTLKRLERDLKKTFSVVANHAKIHAHFQPEFFAKSLGKRNVQITAFVLGCSAKTAYDNMSQTLPTVKVNGWKDVLSREAEKVIRKHYRHASALCIITGSEE